MSDNEIPDAEASNHPDAEGGWPDGPAVGEPGHRPSSAPVPSPEAVEVQLWVRDEELGMVHDPGNLPVWDGRRKFVDAVDLPVVRAEARRELLEEIDRTRQVLRDFDHTGGEEPLWDTAAQAVDAIGWAEHRGRVEGRVAALTEVREAIEAASHNASAYPPECENSVKDAVARVKNRILAGLAPVRVQVRDRAAPIIEGLEESVEWSGDSPRLAVGQWTPEQIAKVIIDAKELLTDLVADAAPVRVLVDTEGEPGQIPVDRADLTSVIGQPTMRPNVEPLDEVAGQALLRLRRGLHEVQMRELEATIAAARTEGEGNDE